MGTSSSSVGWWIPRRRAEWGNNEDGKLGNGTSGSDSDSSTPVTVKSIATATQVSAGSDYTCALLSYEMVRCRGKNSQGQLGNGKTTSSSTPVQVSGITTAAQVSAGLAEHTCASLSDGTVKCWGDGGLGQLGNGQSDEIRTIPVSVIRLP